MEATPFYKDTFIANYSDFVGANVEVSTSVNNSPNQEETDERLINDTNQLLSIFPEELWRTFLDKVTDTAILENFCNASPFFRNILDLKRSQFLFAKVWDIIEIDYTWDTKDDHIKMKKDIGSNTFRRNFKRTTCVSCGGTRNPRSFSSILNLRLVCKSWCTAIDTYNQNHPRHFRMQSEQLYDEAINYEKKRLDWSDVSFERTPEYFARFLKHFEETHESDKSKRSPFLSRSFHFDMYPYGNDNPITPGLQSELTKFVKKFLQRYGHHIWYCELSSWTVSILDYPIIKEWLLLMPNLKTLNLIGVDLFKTNTEFKRELEHKLESDPNWRMQPEFKNLQYFNTYDLPSAVLAGILRDSPNIFKLIVDKENPTNVCNFKEIYLPNLKHFRYRIYTEEEFRNLEASTNNWALTHAYLNFDNDLTIPWKRLFTFFSDKWGNSLETLKLLLHNKLPNSEAKENMDPTDFRFSKLTCIKLVMYYYTSIDFLLVTKDTLEILDICVIYKDDDVDKKNSPVDTIQNQTVQFLGYQERLLTSNIWKLFPRLKDVLIFECDDLFEWDHSEVRQSWVYNRDELEK